MELIVARALAQLDETGRLDFLIPDLKSSSIADEVQEGGTLLDLCNMLKTALWLSIGCQSWLRGQSSTEDAPADFGYDSFSPYQRSDPSAYDSRQEVRLASVVAEYGAELSEAILSHLSLFAPATICELKPFFDRYACILDHYHMKDEAWNEVYQSTFDEGEATVSCGGEDSEDLSLSYDETLLLIEEQLKVNIDDRVDLPDWTSQILWAVYDHLTPSDDLEFWMKPLGSWSQVSSIVLWLCSVSETRATAPLGVDAPQSYGVSILTPSRVNSLHMDYVKGSLRLMPTKDSEAVPRAFGFTMVRIILNMAHAALKGNFSGMAICCKHSRERKEVQRQACAEHRQFSIGVGQTSHLETRRYLESNTLHVAWGLLIVKCGRWLWTVGNARAMDEEETHLRLHYHIVATEMLSLMHGVVIPRIEAIRRIVAAPGSALPRFQDENGHLWDAFTTIVNAPAPAPTFEPLDAANLETMEEEVREEQGRRKRKKPSGSRSPGDLRVTDEAQPPRRLPFGSGAFILQRAEPSSSETATPSVSYVPGGSFMTWDNGAGKTCRLKKKTEAPAKKPSGEGRQPQRTSMRNKRM